MYKLVQMLIDRYEAQCESFDDSLKTLYKEKRFEMVKVVDRAKELTALFMDNLMNNILKDFEHDVTNQLKNANINVDDIHQLLYKAKDEAIKKFEKLEQGLYDIHYAVFRLTFLYRCLSRMSKQRF
jgi:ribosome-associated translation inhibitor RaiA